MLCTTIAIELYTMVDTTMLTFMGDSSVVGYYSNAIKAVKVLISLITSISAVLLPRLSYYYGLGLIDSCENTVNKTIGVLLFFLLPSFVGVFLVTDSIVPIFFGNDFLPAVATMRILSLLIPILGFSSLFGTQILLTFNRESKLLISTIVGAATNITLNSLLIPRLLQNGAAIASVISELIVTLLTLFFAQQVLNFKLSKKVTLQILISTMLMAIAVLGGGFIPGGKLPRFICQIFWGIVVYGGSSVIFHNEVLVELIGLVKKRHK